MHKELISAEEWDKFVQEYYSQAIYCLPTKEATEKFLKWRQENNDSNSK